MLEVDDSGHVVFSGAVQQDGDRYLIEIPTKELAGDVRPGDTYRVAIVSKDSEDIRVVNESEMTIEGNDGSDREQTVSRTAPISVDETTRVTIVADGNRGDGIAKVSGGFVIFVPGTSVGDEVLVRVTDLHGTYANAEVVKRLD